MKRTYITSMVVLAMLLISACEDNIITETTIAEVELSGTVDTGKPTTKAVIEGTLPLSQLSIGVAMMKFATSSPTTIQPTSDNWKELIEWRRAYFGGLGLQQTSVTNGEIKFTNSGGTAIQKVFYDDTGMFYFLKAVYPYEKIQPVNSVIGGIITFEDIHGADDILCSSLGWGNMEPDKKQINTLKFKHVLTKLNLKIEAENDATIGQYGIIESIHLIDQPTEIMLSLSDGIASNGSSITEWYPAVDFTEKNLTLTAADCGYVLALPNQKYTFRIQTKERLSFYVEYKFPVSSLPGTAYDVTFRFVQANEIEIFAKEADEWWMSSTFD